MIIIFKEKQRGCKNSFYLVIVDSFLEVNHAMIIIFKEKQRCCKNSFYLVEERFYSPNVDDIVNDSFLEANCAIVIYFRNREWTHEF